ncbi:Scarecrow-like protein 8 [Musa troglodytarum]|uniref:Scarecrow-like protein 8 n=1 Tax=Musa troglodytarum TaxID=320322 RepID=A0A9E7EXX0_9LILI|nr:Scarecrow-like protein 8 [Musa troglodytarum]
MDAATANLTLLKRAADTRGDAEQRLMAVMVTALLSRLNHPQVGISHPIADLRSPEHFAATQMLYSLSPCFKLGFVTANSAILDATKDEPKIHILDFEVGQGGQYAALIQTVAERLRLRPGKPPPTIRITAIIDPSSPFTNINAGNLRAVGDRIKKLAERFGVPGEEALVVNLPFVLSRVPDESVSPENPRDELLRRVCALRPRLVAIAEQEINTSTAPFPARLAEACKHYGALLESLEAAAQGSSGPERGGWRPGWRDGR